MRSILVAFVIAGILFTISTRGYAQEVRDLGFEQSEPGKLPEGWSVPTAGWSAELSADNAASGERAMKLFKPGESNAPFGNLMTVFPGAEYAGKHVTLTSKIRVVGSGHAQMWLRVDLAGGGMGAFDNMQDRPIFADSWKPATIDADIEPDAAALNIGFISLDGATVFIDDVKLQLSSTKIPMQEPSPPRELSGRGLENVVAAAKLLSYVRFFHPSDQAVGVPSWDQFAVDLMDRAEPASDASDLAKRLTAAFANIAPTVDIWAGAPARAPAPRARPAEATQFATWRHLGAGSIAPPNPMQIYQSSVEKTPLSSSQSDSDALVVVKSLGGGVSCRLPIGVFADDKGTLPHGATSDATTASSKPPKLNALNRSTRLAGIALGWGVFQHFYPYFDVVKTDWDAALPAALSKAASDADASAYASTLSEMVAKLHDGHGNVSGAGTEARSFLPLEVEWMGTDLIVVGKSNGTPGEIEIGDAIVQIDTRPIEACFATVSKQISAATDGWCRYRSQSALMHELPTQDPAHLVVRKPDASTVNVDLARVRRANPRRTPAIEKPANGAELWPGIVYFDLNGAETKALDKVMPKLAEASAIIFDLRGYPGTAAYELMEHLIDEPATSARWCVPLTVRPDREGVEWNESGRWQLEPKEPRLAAKIAFLTDGRAISYAESIMGIVENYKMGEIIGSTTAGTNGNVNPFKLPGGYSITWTGMKVLKHDGSQHHGIGIAPTIPVTPTAKGIAEGRDEVLEKAVDVLQSRVAMAPKPQK